VLVEVTVNINGHSETERLPVMDNRNKAVTNPDMMQINKTEKRCFVKACALHGLGLSLYTGEDLPDIVKMENEAAIRIEREKLMTSIKTLTQKISSAAGFSRQAVGGKAIQNAGLSGSTRDMTNAQLAKLTVALQNELAEVMKNEDVRQAGEDAGQSDDGTA
jgi:hypothetical protein